MNCEDMRNAILLAEAGESSPSALAAVEAHLAGCGACAAFRRDLRALSAVATEALASDGPSPAVLDIIRSAARARVEHPARVLVFRRPEIAPLLALAALVAILLGGGAWWGWLRFASPAVSDPATQMHTLVAMVTTDSTVHDALATDGDAAAGQGGVDEQRMRALARQLLRMEGFAVDEEAADEAVSPLS